MKKFIALLTLLVMIFSLCGCDALEDLFESDPKTFTAGAFSITLTEDFTKIKEGEYEEYEGFFAAYKSDYVHVLVLQELYEDIGEEMTLDEYIELSLEVNDMPGKAVKDGEGYRFVTYIENEDGENMFYRACYYEGEDGFYVVSFVTPQDNLDEYGSDFEKWAESVDVG